MLRLSLGSGCAAGTAGTGGSGLKLSYPERMPGLLSWSVGISCRYSSPCPCPTRHVTRTTWSGAYPGCRVVLNGRGERRAPARIHKLRSVCRQFANTVCCHRYQLPGCASAEFHQMGGRECQCHKNVARHFSDAPIGLAGRARNLQVGAGRGADPGWVPDWPRKTLRSRRDAVPRLGEGVLATGARARTHFREVSGRTSVPAAERSVPPQCECKSSTEAGSP